LNLSFYAAAVGVSQQQERLNVHGNNIANVNTYGFRNARPSFTQLMYDNVDGIDGENLPRGTGSRLDAAEVDFRGTAFYDSGLPMDYAIDGYGFFALQDHDTGEISYSRDGSFSAATFQTENGLGWFLSDGNGRYVLDANRQPIPLADPNVKTALPVGIFDFLNYNGMRYLGENRFAPVPKNVEAPATGKLVQGVLEHSNTDLAHELAKVIETQRSFSYMMKMIIASDEVETTVNNLR